MELSFAIRILAASRKDDFMSAPIADTLLTAGDQVLCDGPGEDVRGLAQDDNSGEGPGGGDHKNKPVDLTDEREFTV